MQSYKEIISSLAIILKNESKEKITPSRVKVLVEVEEDEREWIDWENVAADTIKHIEMKKNEELSYPDQVQEVKLTNKQRAMIKETMRYAKEQMKVQTDYWRRLNNNRMAQQYDQKEIEIEEIIERLSGL